MFIQQQIIFFELIFSVDFKTDYNVEIEKLMELMLRENCCIENKIVEVER